MKRRHVTTNECSPSWPARSREASSSASFVASSADRNATPVLPSARAAHTKGDATIDASSPRHPRADSIDPGADAAPLIADSRTLHGGSSPEVAPLQPLAARSGSCIVRSGSRFARTSVRFACSRSRFACSRSRYANSRPRTARSGPRYANSRPRTARSVTGTSSLFADESDVAGGARDPFAGATDFARGAPGSSDHTTDFAGRPSPSSSVASHPVRGEPHADAPSATSRTREVRCVAYFRSSTTGAASSRITTTPSNSCAPWAVAKRPRSRDGTAPIARNASRSRNADGVSAPIARASRDPAALVRPRCVRHRPPNTRRTSSSSRPVSSQRSSDVGISPAASNASMKDCIVKRAPSCVARSERRRSISTLPIT